MRQALSTHTSPVLVPTSSITRRRTRRKRLVAQPPRLRLSSRRQPVCKCRLWTELTRQPPLPTIAGSSKKTVPSLSIPPKPPTLAVRPLFRPLEPTSTPALCRSWQQAVPEHCPANPASPSWANLRFVTWATAFAEPPARRTLRCFPARSTWIPPSATTSRFCRVTRPTHLRSEEHTSELQ